jgi:hypothetical protein
MNLTEIKEKLINILLEEGYKRKDITEDTEVQEVLYFSIKKINYQIYIEDEETITIGIVSIDDTDYTNDFLQQYDESGDISFFGDYLMGLDETDHTQLRKIWIDIEKLEEKYADTSIGHDVYNIIKEKFGCY